MKEMMQARVRLRVRRRLIEIDMSTWKIERIRANPQRYCAVQLDCNGRFSTGYNAGRDDAAQQGLWMIHENPRINIMANGNLLALLGDVLARSLSLLGMFIRTRMGGFFGTGQQETYRLCGSYN